MKKFLFFLGFLWLSEFMAQAYYGRHATEATLSFTQVLDTPTLDPLPSLSELNNPKSFTHEKMSALVYDQVRHLVGIFNSPWWQKEWGSTAVLGLDYEVTFTKVETSPTEKGRMLLGYSFRGKEVFDKDTLGRAKAKTVPLAVPRQPDRIYKLGMKWGVNECTNPDDRTKTNFYYYWDPKLPNCPLRGDKENVLYFTGKVEALPNTTLTYPEYDQLWAAPVLNISVFLGYIADLTQHKHRYTADDGNLALKFLEKALQERGFVLTARKDNFREYPDRSDGGGINLFRIFEKTVTHAQRTQKVQVKILLSDTGLHSVDKTFHLHFVTDLKEANILVYDGHSGDDATLVIDVDKIAGLEFPRNQYQLLFLNACDSYPNFLNMYLKARGGSKLLDLVLSGVGTIANVSGPNDLAFLAGFLDGKALSFQKILSNIEISNGGETFLTGVAGDEDNSFHP